MKKIDFNLLAREIMFHGFNSKTIEKHGLQYRKGQDIKTLGEKLKLAIKNGHHRTETELEMFEVYLKGVFKLNSTKD